MELNSKGLYQSSGKEKDCCCLVFPSSTKREITHFHVLVVQRRQRNVQKSVMHVQSCCFVNLNLLLVCTWRHGGHVGGQEQKHFSPLGTKLYFHVNSSRKYSFVLTPDMAALSRGCKPRIALLPFSLTWPSSLLKLPVMSTVNVKTLTH